MELITQILAVVPDWIEAIALLIAGASAVAALTPTKRDDAFFSKALAIVKKIANLLALNVANAKPKDDAQ